MTTLDYVQSQIGFPERINPDTLAGEFNDIRQIRERAGVNAPVLPYLATIRRKLIDQRIKDIDIGRGPEEFGLANRGRVLWRHPSAAHLPVSARTDLVVLAGGGDAGADHERADAAVPELRSPPGNDPLANMEIDPLRPLNNLIWGYIQDEQHRLTVVRRNYEYDHHYGLRLAGRAVRDVRTADSRSKFLEAFHTAAQHHRGILQAR